MKRMIRMIDMLLSLTEQRQKMSRAVKLVGDTRLRSEKIEEED